MFFRKQKPVGNDNRREAGPPTQIAADTTIEGRIVSDGEVHVEGTLRGTVKARVCVVEKGGTVEGDVSADDVIVRGRVVGPLRGDHVHLQDGAWVEGDITSVTIAIDTGARLSGAVWQADNGHDPAPAAAAVPALGYQEPPKLFGEMLWGARQDDDYRPLKTVKPRSSGGRG